MLKNKLNIFKYLLPGRIVRRIPPSKRKYLYIGIGALIIVVLPIVLGEIIFPKNSQAAWFNENWQYRTSIEITAHTATQSAVFINLTGANDIDTSDTERFQTDCGDLRFTDKSGNILPYYIASGCGGTDTVVHVFMETFPIGAQTVYYYYGNKKASNGYASSDFATEASGYTIGSQGAEESVQTPVAYWAFDEGNGTVANDSGTNGVTGTISGAVWRQEAECLSGKCLYFDGVDDNVGFGDHTSVEFANGQDFSISMWVKNPLSGTDTVLAKKAATTVGNSGYMINHESDGDMVFYASDGTDQFTMTGTGAISENEWMHIVVVYDDDSTSNTTIYVNGRNINPSQSGTLSSIDNLGVNSQHLKIGSESDDQAYFEGFVDDVKIYSSALSPAQISANYIARGSNEGSGAVLGASDQSYLADGLVGYWKMDEIAANSCTGGTNDSCDSSGNAFDGAWTGNATATDSGKFSWGTIYDGTGDYTVLSNSTTLKPTTDLTISTWFKTTPTGNMRIVSNGAGTLGYELIIINGGIEYNLGVNGTERDINSSIGYNDGNWHLVTATYDGSTMKLYMDGVLSSSEYNPGAVIYSGTTLHFATWSSSAGSFPLDGELDDVRIYNRAFSGIEAEQLYNFGPSPFLYYDFEEGTGSTVVDRSGNNLNATWSGTGPRYGIGKYGKGGTFNKSDDQILVDIPDSITGAAAGATGLANGSYSFWIKPTVLDTSGSNVRHTIMNRNDGASNNGDMICGLRVNGNYSCDMDDGAGSGPDGVGTGSNSVKLNTWNHVAMTWENDGTDTIAKVYLNGVLKDNVEGRHIVRPYKRGLDLIVVGTDYAGQADEFRMYNYTRSPKQIIEDMNASHPAGGSPVGSAIGHWKFDGGHGNVASNSGTLGDKAHGAMINFASPPSNNSGWTNAGKFGKALNFDGTNDQVLMGSDAALDDMTSLTMSGWINVRSRSNSPSIFDKASSGTPSNGWLFWMNTTGRLNFQVDTTGTTLNVVTTSSVPISTWTHVSLTWDGGLESDNVHIYINGVEAPATTRTDGTGTRETDAAYSLKVGGSNGGSFSLNGWIDEVKLYNSVLSSSEIKVDMNSSGGVKFGVLGTDIDGKTASDSAARMYCVPGDTTASCAPIGEWLFEQGSGNMVSDTSGRSNNGTWIGSGPVRWGAGKVGKAGVFNGTDDYVDAGAGITLGAGARSVEAWVYVNDTSTTQKIFMNAPSNFDRFILEVQSGTIRGGFYDGATYAASGAITTGWHHLVLTYSSSTTYLYIDGVRQTGALTMGSTISGLEIGRNGGGNQYFNGKIDHVRLYDYDLSVSQVAWAYNRGKPIVHYKFDECQGGVAYDSSGYNLHGNILIPATGSQNTLGTCTDGNSTAAWYNGRVGKFNSSLNFDGTNDYVTLADNNYLDLISNVTLSAWIKPDSVSPTRQGIVSKRTTSGAGAYMLGLTDSRIEGNFPTTGVINTSTGTIIAGVWTHVVITYDGSFARFYKNGALIQTTAETGNFSNSSHELRIGHEYVGADYYFSGQIDDVQIFNYPLTAVQVRNIYNQNSAVRFGPISGAP